MICDRYKNIINKLKIKDMSVVEDINKKLINQHLYLNEDYVLLDIADHIDVCVITLFYPQYNIRIEFYGNKALVRVISGE
jgi:hypothetical protein